MKTFIGLLLLTLSIHQAHAQTVTPLAPREPLASAHAESAAETLVIPPPIVHLLDIEASNGTCEARWQEYANTIGVIQEDVAPGMMLYLIPCALWAHNLAWTGFVTLEEPAHPDGYLTLPMRFVDYSPYEGLVARDVIHNIRWDSETKTLRARFYLNGKEECGSAGEYKWDTGQRNLLLQTLIKQDQCEGTMPPWTPVYTR